MFMSLSSRSLCVGFAMNSPFTRATRTAPTGPAKGMSETMSAAEAPLMVRISGSCSPSALNTVEMICVS